MAQYGSRWPRVTAMVLNWNGKELLATCLPPLLEQDYPDYELVVIDNGSEDGSIAYVREQFPEVAILDNGRNLGYSGGLNAGMRQAEGEIVVLLNNDVIVLGRHWLRQLVAPFRTGRRVGITGCKLYFPDGKTLQHAGARLTYPLAYSEHIGYLEEDRGQYDRQVEVDYVTGAAVALSQEVIREVGLLDESFAPIYYEEVDLCYRIRAAGYRVLYVPEAAAIHDESASFGRARERHQLTFHRNRLRFIFKHYDDAQILDEFIPAEEGRIATAATPGELHTLRQVFMELLLALPERLAARGDSNRLGAFQAALLRLRQATLARQLVVDPPASEDPLPRELAAHQRIEEPAFVSDVPLAGPLIAAFRQAWNSVAARWYVQLIMEQQQAFNRLVAQMLAAQARARDEVRTNAGDIDRLSEALLGWQEESRATAEALAERLAAIDQRLARLEGDED
jgi:GT2 family glycosyltransferase